MLLSTFLLCLAVSSSGAAAPSKEGREALRKSLADVLAQTPLSGARTSVQVQSLDDGTVVFAQNADDLLNPASNAKLFTAAAALIRLGPEYRFETEFLSDREVSGKVPVLYVRGKGDPSLSTERLYNIAGELYHAGLREVRGDLVVDDGWFDGQRLAPGFDQEVGDRAYLAPSGALSLNWNAVAIYLRPGERTGARAYVEIEPASDYFLVDNELVTAALHRRFSVTLAPGNEKQRVVVRGTVPAERGVLTLWKKIDEPALYFGHTLRRLLTERGIKVRGRVRPGSAPENARLLYVAQSESLDLILKRLNKVSSNFVAEQLIKTLGAEIKGPPGSFSKGIEVVEDFLHREVGIVRGSYVMRNGSGLNDANRFSASQINRLLRFMYQRFPLAPEYLSSMGIAGKDGTLKYRFEGSEAVGRLRGKTGTLENIAALSGYVQSIGGEKFVFAVLVNDYLGRSISVVQALDAMEAGMAASGGSQGPGRAVAAMMNPETAIGSLEELTSRVRTYLSIARPRDRKSGSFLRTSWRSEGDPAVRAVIAAALYESDPGDYAAARMYLDSFSADEVVYGRLCKVGLALGVDVPGLSPLFELAAQGNPEALGQLLRAAAASKEGEKPRRLVGDALAEVSRTAPEALLAALRAASSTEREEATGLLARGLATANADHPLWSALRKMLGSVDAASVSFAKQLEQTISLKSASEKGSAVQPAAATAPAPVITPATAKPEIRPGG